MRWKHPRTGLAWGQCDFCGFDVPVDRLRRTKYGIQCTGAPGANCYDTRPDRDDYLAMTRFKVAEGVRKSSMPVTNTATEGTE